MKHFSTFFTRLLLFVLLIAGMSLTTEAKYKQTCVVRYATQNGWSKQYQVDVTFMTGYELNEATTSYRYSAYSVYAIIFWDRDQASVIKLSGYFSCGNEVTKSCITSSVMDLKGKDQDGDEWKICISSYCF